MPQNNFNDSDEIFYLGVDGGGIKPEVAIVNPSGKVVMQYFGAAANPCKVGKDVATKNLVSAMAQAASLIDRDLDDTAIGGIVVGLIDTCYETSRCKALLREDPFLFGIPLNIYSEIEIATFGVSNNGAAVTQISDIGAAAFGRDFDGNTYKTGEYALGGNRGSGVAIVNQALRLAVSGEDMGLSACLLDHFKASNISDLILNLEYVSRDYLRRDFVKYAKLMNEVVNVVAAESYAGNTACHRIFLDTANSLSEMTIANIERLGIQNESFPLGLIGNTWRTGDLLSRPYLAKIKEYAPNIYVKNDSIGPAHAAALMALKKSI